MLKISYLRWYLLTGLMGAMCWIFMAPTPMPFGIEIQRELGFVGHLLIFTIFSLACFSAFPRSLRQTAMVLLLMAICLEAVQILLPSRGADIMDAIVNGIGILVGYGIFRALNAIKLCFDPYKG